MTGRTPGEGRIFPMWRGAVLYGHFRIHVEMFFMPRIYAENNDSAQNDASSQVS